jgi:hypothetical protein
MTSRFKPYAVQREALAKGYHKPGFAYYLEQGLGKTGLTLEEFSQKVAEGTADVGIIVSPGTFKPGWVAEGKKYEWAWPITGYVYQSNATVANEAWLRTEGRKRGSFVVVNYEALRGDKCRDFLHRLIAGRSSYLSFDESVQISTHDAAQTRAAIDLAKYCTWKRVLSGRPQKSGPHDLWSQLRACGLIVGNYFAWRNTYCELGGFKGKSVVGAKNQETLAALLSDYAFFASKKDWTDLPEKSYTTRSYDLGPVLSKHYNEMLEDFLTFIEDETVVTVEAAITKYIKLAQIQSGYIIDGEGNTVELVEPGKNPRLLALREFIDSELSGKLLIPYNSKYAYKLLSTVFPNTPFIRGGMSPEEVEAEKALFNLGAAPMMLLQTRAAKYGHTLLGNHEAPCFTTAFFENTYSIDDRSQIEDRNHRHGQAHPVTYVDFVGTTEDQKMIEALQRKDSVFQALRGLVAARRAGRR